MPCPVITKKYVPYTIDCTPCYVDVIFSVSAEHLWKTITSVSKQGRAKGRHKGRKKPFNLNAGQTFGEGIYVIYCFFLHLLMYPNLNTSLCVVCLNYMYNM